MPRIACIATVCIATVAATLVDGARTAEAKISGDYLEMRTCSVYTGPCFANAEIGLTGQHAIMAWSIDAGEFEGVDLTGLRVVMSVRASGTLGYGGGVVIQPDPIQSVILVDDRASPEQRAALAAFAVARAGKVAGEVVRVATAPIEMSVDHVEMEGRLTAGGEASLVTRKLEKGDCVCTNEIVFYPPLSEVQNASPAYTLDGGFRGRGLGAKWSNPDTRSAFLATFSL